MSFLSPKAAANCIIASALWLVISCAVAAPLTSLQSAKHWAISQGMSSHAVTDLLQDQQGYLWIATHNGLQRFDGLNFKHYMAGQGDNYLPSNDIRDLWLNQQQQLWVVTSRGLAVLQPGSDQFQRFTSSNNDITQPPNEITRVISNFNQQPLLLINQQLWGVGDDNRVYRHNLTYGDEVLTDINNMHLGDEWIWLSQADGDIYVWDGDGQTVFKLTKPNPITDPLPKVGFNHIMQWEQQLWFAHDGGIFQLNHQLRMQRQLSNQQDLGTKRPITRMVYTDNHHLLLGTDQGLVIIEKRANGTMQLSDHRLAELPQSLAVSAFAVDHLGRLWAGAANGGLYQLSSYSSGIDFSQLERQQIDLVLNSNDLPAALQDFTAAVRDHRNNYWVADDIGLNHYSSSDNRVYAVFPLPIAEPSSVSELQEFAEYIFVTTREHGLFIFNSRQKRWVRPTPDLDLFSHEQLRLARQDSKIWVADQKRAVAINEFIQVVDQRPLIQPPQSSDFRPIDLTVEQQHNQLTFDFVSPLAPHPSQVQYRYRLLELQPEWQYTGRPLQPITLSRLPAGDYQLQIQASADGRLWQFKAQRDVTISGPWWQSSWALMTYLMVALLLPLALGFWVKRLQQQRVDVSRAQQRLNMSIRSSGIQLWDWDVENNEIKRDNIWPQITEFPIDGIRNGVAGGKINIHPDDINKVTETLESILAQQTDRFDCNYRMEFQGQWLWLMDRGEVTERNADGSPCRVQGALTNISGLARQEERLNMLALSLTNISDGICIFDRYFRKLEINKAFARITGFDREQVLNQPLTLPACDNDLVAQIKRTVLRDGSWRGELTDMRADGSEFQLELTLDAVYNDQQTVEFIVASFSDVTERRDTENELRRLSNTDSLTGLPNRSYFQVSHSNLVRKKVAHSLLLFDLDDFKKINDSLGHAIGDELLCLVAERLTDITRRQDTLYRLGGDEFGLLIEDQTHINRISTLANQINQVVAQPYQVQGHEVVIGSSIGIVLYPHDGTTSQELLQKADTAMYHAKQRGGNCHQFFSQSMNENAIQRLAIENQLRKAIKDQQVQVFYQPKIEVGSQHIAGIEALARIQRDDGSYISPAEFIPLAEETGLIVPLSEQVLRQSCRDMRNFMQQAGAPRNVAINLSARQFLSSSLALQIESILADEQLHPRHIEFEITEGMVMTDPERAIAMLENLADMGVQLALDDFGTGYSSLAYLKRFPIHTLKVDKAFVDDIASDDKDRNMVASIIAMAHNLNLKVVAEGVESQTQLQILKTLRCEYIQGFYYAKPMPADEFSRFIDQHNHSQQLA